ncbi:single-stranded DNA-binding protein, partial [Sneathia sp. DSM 16630]|nr:single-stranded DNA-binding protein [Sneathia sp. DSM 16630]
MNKIILQAKNKKELEDLIKVNISLQDDETYVIKEIKKPID